MKKITKERLITALDKIDKLRDEKVKDSERVVTLAALHGMENIVNVINGCGSSETRLALEASFFDVSVAELSQMPLTLEGFQEAKKAFFAVIDHYHAKAERVWNIQRKHNISGLQELKTSLGDQLICHPWVSDELVLIPEDLIVLNQWKMKLFTYWSQHVTKNQLRIYRCTPDGWKQGSVDEVKALLPFHQWADIFEEVTYISPSEMERQGFDTSRSVPTLPDDEKYWQVSLSLGNGLDVNAADCSISFCATNERTALGDYS
ncbi:MAG: hypothetical protein WBB28_01210 [Crinalium sp.]